MPKNSLSKRLSVFGVRLAPTLRKRKRGSIAPLFDSDSTNYADRRGATAMKAYSRSFGASLRPNNFTPLPKNRIACAVSSHHCPRAKPNCFCFEVMTSVIASSPLPSIFIPHLSERCSLALRNHSERSTYAAMASNNNIASNNALGRLAGATADSTKWVDDRLALLTPHETWSPDFGFAQSRLRERLAATKHSWSRMIGWSGVLVTASLIIAIALTSAPAPRVLAQRCVDCSIALWQSISPNAAAVVRLIAVSNRMPAPDFTLTDENGNSVRLSDRKGKVVLVNFWATWCGGCQVEIPWFKDLYGKHKNAGLDAIGISMDSDGWTSVRPYLKEKPIPYTIVIGNDTTAKEFRVTAMPVTVLIDRQGKVAAIHSGIVAESTYRAEIESLLK